MATAPATAPKKLMILKIGYDEFIIPAALQDKAHLLLQLQKIDSHGGYDQREEYVYAHFFADAEMMVRNRPMPSPMFSDREHAKAYLESIKPKPTVEEDVENDQRESEEG